MKLTKESAQLVDKYGLRESSKTGLSTGVLKGNKGQIKGFVEFAKGARLTNPALLAGATGLMAQLAMRQTMDEITDYLAKIDEKVDDVLRAQKDAALVAMIGADLVIEEAMTIREPRSRFRSGSPFWLAASSCRTRSPCSNSTGCWIRLRRSWTGIASGFGPRGGTGWKSSRGAPSV